MKHFLRFISILILTAAASSAHAYNMRQITTDDGLTNSAIISLYCDSGGLLWVGTCDGVNAYDGSSVYSARRMPEYAGISGNIIENITESAPGVLWVQTNYGFNRINPAEGELRVFPQFQGQEKIRVSPDGTVLALSEDCTLAYCIEGVTDDFVSLGKLPVPFRDIRELVAADGYVRLFTVGGIIDIPMSRGADGISLGKPVAVSSDKLAYAFNDGETTLAIDTDGNILEYRAGDHHPMVLGNIRETMALRGEISDMLRDNKGNIFVSFFTDGVIKINNGRQGPDAVEDLGIKIGVFCLEKSTKQNVVWIGTDCHGVYTYSEGPYSIQSINFTDLGNKLTHPVRAVYLDRDKNLWLGTKGDGMLMVKDFNEFNGKEHGETRLFTSATSGLPHNSVFSFSGSSRPVIWIATEEGLCYYSYKSGTINRIDPGEAPLTRVYSVYESDDSTLLVTTNGYGVFKARIAGSPDRPVLTDIRRYTVDGGNFSSNYFFSQALDNRGAPLFCNRGFGAFVLEGDSLRAPAPLHNDYGNKTIYDVFAAIRDEDALWLGTGHGLMKIDASGDRLFAGPEHGFANSTIHSMLKDDDGNLWLSTNQGLIRFNTATEECNVFARNYGISVNEFSDGASFKTGNSLIFGGVDGLAIVTGDPDFITAGKYLPQLSVARLRIAGEDMPLHRYLSREGDEVALRLSHDQNYFSVGFLAPDYVNAANYTYYYTLDGKVWINNGPNNTVTFTRLEHGHYALRVKYVNRETGAESRVFTLDITVGAPWYLSVWAKIVYLLLTLGAIFLASRFYVRRQKERQARALERMEQTHREEVYEEKLRFFTNITHEFCTPLTLIFGSCERILANQDADAYMLKYVSLIRSNTERLNSLIQDLIDFRRIETGHKPRVIRSVCVSDLCNDIYSSFQVIAEQNGVEFRNEAAPSVTFNTDYKALLRIMSNLLSNAFKYTPAGGTVKLGLGMKDDSLVVSVYNTGKGISPADRERIFNRYSILDNVEENATKGLSSRNGLGMAICSSLVELLGGRIDIESEVGSYALFTVTLPPLPCSEAPDSEGDSFLPALPAPPLAAGTDAAAEAPEPQSGRADAPGHCPPLYTLLVIDDNNDILTLLTDSLSEYEVITAGTAEAGLDILKDRHVDLIITDVMMPGTDGVTLTRLIKGNRHTGHIPLIILSAKNTSAEKVEGLASGADAYIGKPFHLSYLRAVIVRLLENRERMKEYYNSSASAFTYSNGQLMERESKDFIDGVTEYIDSHIDDPDLSTEAIAKHMQFSVRNLYRKFKDLELPPPNDFIKLHRMAFAAKLLVTTSLTVQEIIFRCGFNNRTHFYREFDKHYSMTPKVYRQAHKTKTDLDASPDGGE